jgi:hypothetical protein
MIVCSVTCSTLLSHCCQLHMCFTSSPPIDSQRNVANFNFWWHQRCENGKYYDMLHWNDRFIPLFQRVMLFVPRNGWGILYFLLEAPENMELDRWVCSRWCSVCSSQLVNYFTVTQKLDFVWRVRKCPAEPSQATRRRLCVNRASFVTGVYQKPVASSEWNSVRTFSSLRHTVHCLNYSSWCISVKSGGEIQISSLQGI